MSFTFWKKYYYYFCWSKRVANATSPGEYDSPIIRNLFYIRRWWWCVCVSQLQQFGNSLVFILWLHSFFFVLSQFLMCKNSCEMSIDWKLSTVIKLQNEETGKASGTSGNNDSLRGTNFTAIKCLPLRIHSHTHKNTQLTNDKPVCAEINSNSDDNDAFRAKMLSAIIIFYERFFPMPILLSSMFSFFFALCRSVFTIFIQLIMTHKFVND